MSVLHKDEPMTTAEIADRQRPASTGRDAAMENAAIDPSGRRPPQTSAAETLDDVDAKAVDANTLDDTYDGEIVSATTEPSIVSAGRRQVAATGSGSTSVPAPARPTTAGTQSVSSTSPAADSQNDGPLFDEDELRDFRGRWDQVQTSFVDEPRHAVEQADTLVATVVKRIAEQFAEERAKLEQQWDRGDSVSTEDLRQGFKRYRSFFDRLLSF